MVRFYGSKIGDYLIQLTTKFGFKIEWRPAFSLNFDCVPDDFRGPAMPLLSQRLLKQYALENEKVLTIALVGRAAGTVVSDPERWKDWGTSAESLQHLKQLWHCLVQFGTPVNCSPELAN